MTNLLDYFRMVLKDVLPSESSEKIREKEDYVYYLFNDQTFTPNTFYYFLSKDYLIVAGTGSGYTKEFLNSVKLFRRECKQWNLVNERQLSGVAFSAMKVKIEATDLLANYLKEKVPTESDSYRKIETYAEESMNSVFSNQFENLHKLYLNEA